MNAQKLLELALLDACGLLERDEQDRFEAAFNRAPESIKSQIRREQSRFADQNQLLPDVTPRPELRSLVINAVRKAAGAATSRDTLDFEKFVRSAVVPTPADLNQRKSLPRWRVAAVALAATTVFGAVLSLELRNQIENMGEQLSTTRSADFFLGFGEMPGLRQAIMSTDSERVIFENTDESSTAIAAIYSDVDARQSFLVCHRLPVLENGLYEIVILDDDNNIMDTVATFQSNGETDGHEFAFDSAMRGTIGIAARTATGGLKLIMISA